MHQRSLPRFPDLKSFLDHLHAAGDLHCVSAPVSMHLEATEVHRRTIGAWGPVLRLETPLHANGNTSTFPVVANLFGTRERVAAGLGTDVPGLASLGKLLAWMRTLHAPRNLSEARSLMPAAKGALSTRPRIVGCLVLDRYRSRLLAAAGADVLGRATQAR